MSNRFARELARRGAALRRGILEVLQINVGRRCNQACRHCHVEAGPWRTEMMEGEVAQRVAAWIETHRPPKVDITGGAPEMNEHFRFLVTASRAAGCGVIDRNNLTILTEPGYEDLAEFLATNEVEVIASMPCYEPGNVDRQRGRGVFDRSIAGLRRLNAVGYGTRLPLSLVYNPVGPTLPPDQAQLEADYRMHLRAEHGVEFTRLLAFANQPIGRFADDLQRQGRLEEYFALLEGTFNGATLAGLMCRTTLSVGHRGELFDCDFNQMLGMGWGGERRGPVYLWEISPYDLEDRAIATGSHCLACSAGSGSGCGGALVGQ